MIGIQSRSTKTAVFAGTSKQTTYKRVLSLEQLCLNVLKDNYMYITYFGNAPFYLIKPVLQKCNPDHLARLEDYNPDLITDDDELWEAHCKSEFKDKFPSEDETWRELYIRLKYERELKLKSITAHIKITAEKATPVRKTKFAFVESLPKPPRGVKRAQDMNGTKFAVTGSSKLAKAGVSGILANKAAEAVNKRPAIGSSGGSASKKTKKAPLMRKTLDMLKSRFRR